MTVFLWDASHYDGTLTTADLAEAHREGIVGFTHKLGEGLGNIDPTAATALAAARNVGISVVGAYWFNHGNDRPADEVAALIAEANRHEPWWTDFPGWFWQADLERSPTGLPSPAWAKEFCDRLRDRTDRVVIAYASHGIYGNTLTGLGHPLWNANYPSNRQASFKDLYPGDTYSGWNRYSGQIPVLCQYTSSATIAGHSTCDANAYRGTLTQLLEQVMATIDVTPASRAAIADAVLAEKIPNIPADTDFTTLPLTALNTAIYRIRLASAAAAAEAAQANATLAGIVKTEAAIQATLDTLTTSTAVDTAALAAQIKAVGDTESTTVAALSAQVADAEQRIADLEAQLAAGGTME